MLKKEAALQGKWTVIAWFKPIAAGKCSSWIMDSCWALLKGYRKAAGKCPKPILYSLWAILRGYWKAEWNGMPKFPPSANRRQGRNAQRLFAKTWQFPSLFSEETCFCSYLLKVKGAVENFKNPQEVFSYFCFFHPHHF
jgi:hypothetical protein